MKGKTRKRSVGRRARKQKRQRKQLGEANCSKQRDGTRIGAGGERAEKGRQAVRLASRKGASDPLCQFEQSLASAGISRATLGRFVKTDESTT